MKKKYLGALTLCTALGVSAQPVIWQKDLKSSTQDFLNQKTTTIDQEYLGSLQSSKQQTSDSKQNNGYDFHWGTLNQQREETWGKFSSEKNHDYLSATVGTIKTDNNKTANVKLIKK